MTATVAPEPTDPLNGRMAVSVPEAARLLGISERHARDLVSEGALEVIHLGTKRVITAVTLRRLLRQDA